MNYDDFQCPFCSRMHETLFPQFYKEYSDRVQIIYKDYPLAEIHPWAIHAAVNANCLAAQNRDAYWDFVGLHARQPAMVNGHRGRMRRSRFWIRLRSPPGTKTQSRRAKARGLY